MDDNRDNTDNGYFSEDASTFGDRLAAARRAAGLTQESFGRKIGIKLKTLVAWENDVSEPRANKLQMIAGVLNASIVWLLTGEGEGVNDPWLSDESAQTDMADFIADLRAIRGENRRLGERLLKLERALAASTGK